MYRTTKELSPSELAHPCLPRWRAKGGAAEKRPGGFTQRERDQAGHWNSCAFFEAHEAYGVPFRENNPLLGPDDAQLVELGVVFYLKVFTNDFEGFRNTLTAIEKRLAELRL